MESSLLSAKVSKTKRSRVFLDVIETAMTQHEPLHIQSTAIAPSAEPVLRWEEGLCEWIVASPLRTKKVIKTTSSARRDRSVSLSDQNSDLEDSGYLSDAKETPKFERKAKHITTMLASPDVLGFGLEMPFHIEFDDKTGLQKPAIESQKAFSIRRSLEPSTSQSRVSNIAQDVVKTAKTENCVVLPDERSDISERPAKKRKSQVVGALEPKAPKAKASKPEASKFNASSLVETAPQLCPEPKSLERVKEREVNSSESETDELAMSCPKPRRRAPVISKTVSRKFVETFVPTKRVSSQKVDISDDELGF